MTETIIAGIPEHLPEPQAAVFRSRLFTAYEEMKAMLPTKEHPVILIGDKELIKQKYNSSNSSQHSENDPKSVQYLPAEPSYSFEQLVLPADTMNEIQNAIRILEVEALVFDTWGLRAIEPNPRSALNFYGPPGTGKTLGAHAIANYLGRKILIASYAEIESKYHGDGPKNVKAIFAAAEKEKSVLFIDEADSLLSKRLTNVTQGSEQAINSMRSQLLICLEQFHGIVIFATNLVQNYDKAFETRVQHISFPMPDLECRRVIWEKLLLRTLPLANHISIQHLAEQGDDVCGRDIKNAIIQSAVQAALNRSCIDEKDLLSAIEKIKNARIKSTEHTVTGTSLTIQEKQELSKKISVSLKKNSQEIYTDAK